MVQTGGWFQSFIRLRSLFSVFEAKDFEMNKLIRNDDVSFRNLIRREIQPREQNGLASEYFPMNQMRNQ